MTTAPDPTRRALLFGRAAAAPPLRPPWALEESDFLDACTACGACVERCPEHVLVAGPHRTPVFDPHLGECTFCGDCAAACTPRALDRTRVPTAWQAVAVAGEACLTRHGVVCSSCRDACPERAIAFPLISRSQASRVPAPSIDADRCTGCGACVGVCPADALSIQPRATENA